MFALDRIFPALANMWCLGKKSWKLHAQVGARCPPPQEVEQITPRTWAEITDQDEEEQKKSIDDQDTESKLETGS